MTVADANTYVLAIDNGTQSVRAIIIDQHGNIVAQGREELQPYFSGQPGWAEQHCDYYWQALTIACEKLWQHSPVAATELSAITVTTQRGTVVCLDSEGKPLRPAIIWLDQRLVEHNPPLSWHWRTLFRLLGASATVNQFRQKAQANWLARHEPALWQKTAKYLLLSGYLSYRLTGEFTDSTAAQVGYLPFDYKKQRWANKRDWKWQALAVKPEQLPTLKAPGQRLGHITADAAATLGVPVGLPLLAAASDKACEILGCGGVSPDIGCMSYGTTATINTTNCIYTEAVRFMPAYPSAIAGQYSTEVMIYRGFWLVSWFKQQFGLREQQQADKQGTSAEQLFDQLLAEVPAGAMGLMLQPYWSPGAREPGPEAKGAMIGFGDVHNRAHMYRAILEGLAYALREGKERLERKNGVPVRLLRVSGGGSQSDVVLQLTADVFNLPVERPHTYETSALGAAITAMVGLGVYPNMDAAISGMTRLGKRFEPQPETAAIYQRLYSDVYLYMYRQLKPLYQRIQQITGYPRQ